MANIDSLAIEIQTNSSGAIADIERLAGALEKIKKSTVSSTAVKNLKNLTSALKELTPVSSNANKLGALADSLSKMSAVGSLRGITNSLKELPGALRGLSGIRLDEVAPQIERIAAAIAPLGNIKAGGLNSVMNGLKKLDEVTDSLDDGTIARFATQIKKLDDELSPVTQKLVAVGSAFNAVNDKAITASGGFSVFGGKLNTTTLNLQNLISVAKSVVSVLRPIVNLLKSTISQAIEWDGIAQRFGRGFGDQAEEVYSWVQRLNKEMGINTQQFMQYSSTYATMLTGFGVASKDASKMALGYMELTYDIWAGYNDTYKKMEDAATAIRSAIAGEVEPIRKAGFTIIESTLEQTAANHGLKISLENATEAQKSYLRYLALVDQANAQGLVGAYAKEMGTAEGAVRTLAQQVKSLAQAFGSLLIPVLVKVAPYIQAFIELVTEAVHWVAAMFGVEIQAINDWSGLKDGIGGVADSAEDATNAVKELKNATLGIDELNIISPQTSSGGAGGAGGGGFEGLDVDSLWDKTIFDNVNSTVSDIVNKMKEWCGITEEIDTWAELFDTRIGKIFITVGLIGTALAGWKIYNLLKDLKVFAGISTLVSGFSGAIAWITEYIAAAKLMAPEVGWMAALFPKLSGWIASVGTALSGAAQAVGAFIGGLSATTVAAFALVVAAVASAVYFVVKNWKELKEATADFFNQNIVPKLEEIKGCWDRIKEALSPLAGVFIKIKEALQPVIDALVEFFEKFDWSWLGKAIEFFGMNVFNSFTGVIAGAFNAGMGVISGFVQVITGLVEIVAGVITAIVRLFQGDLPGAWDACKQIGRGILAVFDGLYDITIGPVVEFIEGVIDWFTELWDVLVGHSIVPDTVDAIVEWFTSLPGKVWGSISEFVSGIIDRFKNLGSDLKDKFEGAWSTVKSWWNTGKEKLKEYVPSIGSIKDALSGAWSAAKEWWDGMKSALKTYTPSIGSIYEALKSRWDSAKTWWGNSKGSLSFTPTVGSIKDKLVSAWNTAKDWWNRNVKLSIPSLSFKVTYSTEGLGAIKKAIVNALGLPGWPKLSFAANGGIFDMGSLIWAGERGAEIVANAGGGKTGVMNVQQMSEAVYEGVYSAVIAAMRASESGGSQSVNVYLDGRQVYASMEQHRKERGASLMGNQVYSY